MDECRATPILTNASNALNESNAFNMSDTFNVSNVSNTFNMSDDSNVSNSFWNSTLNLFNNSSNKTEHDEDHTLILKSGNGKVMMLKLKVSSNPEKSCVRRSTGVFSLPYCTCVRTYTYMQTVLKHQTICEAEM